MVETKWDACVGKTINEDPLLFLACPYYHVCLKDVLACCSFLVLILLMDATCHLCVYYCANFSKSLGAFFSLIFRNWCLFLGDVSKGHTFLFFKNSILLVNVASFDDVADQFVFLLIFGNLNNFFRLETQGVI